MNHTITLPTTGNRDLNDLIGTGLAFAVLAVVLVAWQCWDVWNKGRASK